MWLRAFLVLTLAATAPLQAQPAGADEPLHLAHNALFSSFLPVDELSADRNINSLLLATRDQMWSAAHNAPAFRELVQPFTDLRQFGQSCGIDSVVKQSGNGSFAGLDRQQRDRTLYLLQSCDANGPRHLAATVRNFYVVKGYGGIQEQVTGVKINLFASAEYIEQHRPKLSPSSLRYDRERHELVSKDGPFDILIVGSGPAGSVLAHELRRSGKRVLLLERGSFVIPGSMETRLIDDLIDTRASLDGTIRIRNGMAVGGGSEVNVDLCFAPTSDVIRSKIEGWRKAGRIAPDQFTQAELAQAYEWVKQTIGTRSLSESEINANNHALWAGARRAGLHPKLYALNTYPPGQSPYPVTDKRSAETELLLQALQDTANPLSMVPDAEVRRVLFGEDGEAKRAIGVEVRARSPIPEDGVIVDPNGLGIPPGESYTVHAKTVILSAGALGSPAILLRSGLSNDAIGRGIVLHPSMPVMGLFAQNIDVLSGTEASVYVDDKLISEGYALESMADQPLYAAIMAPGPPAHTFEVFKNYRHLAGFGVMLIDTPAWSNHIVLDDRSEPNIDYTLSEADKTRFADGVADAVRVMFLAGAKEVYLPTTEDVLGNGGRPAVLTRPEQAELVKTKLHFISNRSMVTSAHMQGTDKMGASPADSVVGRDLHVWGTTGLYVVDVSVFPTSVGANPMQSIYTIAKIFADKWNQPKAP
jgi:choline dehydrogenase-like flavoprotein